MTTIQLENLLAFQKLEAENARLVSEIKRIIEENKVKIRQYDKLEKLDYKLDSDERHTLYVINERLTAILNPEKK